MIQPRRSWAPVLLLSDSMVRASTGMRDLHARMQDNRSGVHVLTGRTIIPVEEPEIMTTQDIAAQALEPLSLASQPGGSLSPRAGTDNFHLPVQPESPANPSLQSQVDALTQRLEQVSLSQGQASGSSPDIEARVAFLEGRLNTVHDSLTNLTSKQFVSTSEQTNLLSQCLALSTAWQSRAIAMEANISQLAKQVDLHHLLAQIEEIRRDSLESGRVAANLEGQLKILLERESALSNLTKDTARTCLEVSAAHHTHVDGTKAESLVQLGKNKSVDHDLRSMWLHLKKLHDIVQPLWREGCGYPAESSGASFYVNYVPFIDNPRGKTHFADSYHMTLPTIFTTPTNRAAEEQVEEPFPRPASEADSPDSSADSQPRQLSPIDPAGGVTHPPASPRHMGAVPESPGSTYLPGFPGISSFLASPVSMEVSPAPAMHLNPVATSAWSYRAPLACDIPDEAAQLLAETATMPTDPSRRSAEAPGNAESFDLGLPTQDVSPLAPSTSVDPEVEPPALNAELPPIERGRARGKKIVDPNFVARRSERLNKSQSRDPPTGPRVMMACSVTSDTFGDDLELLGFGPSADLSSETRTHYDSSAVMLSTTLEPSPFPRDGQLVSDLIQRELSRYNLQPAATAPSSSEPESPVLEPAITMSTGVRGLEVHPLSLNVHPSLEPSITPASFGLINEDGHYVATEDEAEFHRQYYNRDNSMVSLLQDVTQPATCLRICGPDRRQVIIPSGVLVDSGADITVGIAKHLADDLGLTWREGSFP